MKTGDLLRGGAIGWNSIEMSTPSFLRNHIPISLNSTKRFRRWVIYFLSRDRCSFPFVYNFLVSRGRSFLLAFNQPCGTQQRSNLFLHSGFSRRNRFSMYVCFQTFSIILNNFREFFTITAVSGLAAQRLSN